MGAGGGSRIKISDEAQRILDRVKEHLEAFNGGKCTNAEALDWLLKDSIEYGSPNMRSFVSAEWPTA